MRTTQAGLAERVVRRPAAARARRSGSQTLGASWSPVPVIRTGAAADAEALEALIRSHRTEGHLLSRDLDEIRRSASRFVVYEAGGAIRACAELAPLSASVAEVRSLVVSPSFRGNGVASELIGEIRRRARDRGFDRLCAFAHDPRFFVRQNFSIVPHEWVPEKIAKDCSGCPLFRRCGQHAMVLPLQEIVRHDASHAKDRRAAVA